MTDEPISERVSRLAGEALSAQARIVRESVEVSRDAWQPGTDPAALSKAWTELVTSEGQRYWQSLATIGLDTARELLALNTRTSAAVLRGLSEATGQRGYADSPDRAHHADHADHAHHDQQVQQVHRPHPHDHPAPTDPHSATTPPAEPETSTPASGRHGAMQLVGPSGSVVHGTLTVANRHPRARRVTVAAGELCEAASGAVAAVSVVVDPARVTVPTGEERHIDVSVELDPAAIQPGRVYAATLEVAGGDEARIDVVVCADPVD